LFVTDFRERQAHRGTLGASLSVTSPAPVPTGTGATDKK
ncbi:MAG: hypothetical protein ACI91B_002658, partial [Planctomycetota bacterium]